MLRDFRAPAGMSADDVDANGDGEVLAVLDLRVDDSLLAAGLAREVVNRCAGGREGRGGEGRGREGRGGEGRGGEGRGEGREFIPEIKKRGCGAGRGRRKWE